MKLQRLLIALSIFNLGLLVFLLAQIEVRFLGFRFLLRSAEVNAAGSVLRGRALEITDEEGRVRASIQLHPASVLPDGTTYPLRRRMVRGWPSAANLTRPMLR